MPEPPRLHLINFAVFDTVFFTKPIVIFRDDRPVGKLNAIYCITFIISFEIIRPIYELKVLRILCVFTEGRHQLTDFTFSGTIQRIHLALQLIEYQTQSKAIPTLALCQCFFGFSYLRFIMRGLLQILLDFRHIEIDQCYEMTHF